MRQNPNEHFRLVKRLSSDLAEEEEVVDDSQYWALNPNGVMGERLIC